MAPARENQGDGRAGPLHGPDARVRDQSRKANSEISPSYGMQPPRRCPGSKVGLLRIGFPSPVARAGLGDPDAGFPVL